MRRSRHALMTLIDEFTGFTRAIMSQMNVVRLGFLHPMRVDVDQDVSVACWISKGNDGWVAHEGFGSDAVAGGECRTELSGDRCGSAAAGNQSERAAGG